MAKFFCETYPRQGSTITLAPYSRAISQVRSVEPESTRMISSAHRTLANVRPIFASSFIATSATDNPISKQMYSAGVARNSHSGDEIVNGRDKKRRGMPRVFCEDPSLA